jgi:hypothetical protein
VPYPFTFQYLKHLIMRCNDSQDAALFCLKPFNGVAIFHNVNKYIRCYSVEYSFHSIVTLHDIVFT